MSNMKLIDLSGRRFGRLVVLRKGGPMKWFCRCDCGVERDVTGAGLRGGIANSCGCAKGERIGTLNRKHMLSNSRAQRIWSDMKRRCSDQSRRDYKYYGGRGITVCDRWKADLSAFVADMGEPPEGMTLDRISADGDYEPGNCRWISLADQQRNKRSNVVTIWRGGTVCMSEIATATGLPYESIRRQVNLGKSGDEAEAHVRAGRNPKMSKTRSRAPAST